VQDMFKRWDMLSDKVATGEELTTDERINGAFYRTRTTKSGTMLEVESYPLLPAGVGAALKKHKPSSETMKWQNQKNAEKRLIRLAECNFDERDYKLDLTYDEAHLPTLENVHKDIRNFIRRMNTERKHRGLAGGARYIAVIEGYDDGSRQKRLHVHMIIDGDIDRKTIKEIWGRGRIHCDELDPEGYGGLRRLAQYMSKDPRGKKRWISSKNLKKPTQTIADRKITHRKARKIAESRLQAMAALERMYKGYRVESYEVRTNPFIEGYYIYAIMRKETRANEQGGTHGQSCKRSGDQADAERGKMRAVPAGSAEAVRGCGRKARS